MTLAKEIEVDVSTEEIEKQIVFWFFKILNKNGGGEWRIDHKKFIEHLRFEGFRRYDINENYIFIRISSRIIYEVTVTAIQDHAILYINTLDEEIETGLSRDELLTKFYTSPAIFFNEKKLSMLGLEPGLEFNKDTKDSGFIYYRNGFVKCTAKGYSLYPYQELEGYVFRNQIINREFHQFAKQGMFEKFVFNISGKNKERFLSLQTMFGYLLHSFYETKMKAVNLTDSKISDSSEGRTGKTLCGRGLSQMKNVCELAGKDFDPSNKHKYEAVKLDTQIVFLNDLRKKFDFENLFNDISDGITVDPKNKHPFIIRAKILISANDTFRVEGASARDRVCEFELADHYSDTFSPEDEFGAWFFRDWDNYEWLSFDNFMVNCLNLYLQNGIIEAESINLDKRKQLQHTNADVVEFLDEKIKNGALRYGMDYDKKLLHLEFLQQYPEYVNDKWLSKNRNFMQYLRTYVSYSTELKGKISERKSDGHCYIRFERIESKQLQIKL